VTTLLYIVAVSLAAAFCSWLAYGKGAQRGHNLSAEMRGLREQVRLHRTRKEEAYRERNLVAALLAGVLQQEGIAAPRGVPDDPEKWRIYRGYDAHFKGWGNCLYIEPPSSYGIGQLGWHFPDDQAWMIDVIGPEQHPTGWDRRSREERQSSIEHYFSEVS
jgi:hypothetical protein